MAKTKGKHLALENREVIEQGIRDGDSATKIGKRIGVCASTVTREARDHRSVRVPKRKPGARPSLRCAKRDACQRGGTACPGCSSRLTSCKDCRTRDCTAACPDFELRMCPRTERRPYVCPPEGCPKRSWCGFPKCSYRAPEAQAAYGSALSSSRSGACVSEAELAAANAVVPLSRQGWSFEAIWQAHGGEMPFCVRTAYSYQEKGLLGVASIDMPRKVRLMPKRPVAKRGRARVDRSGREYSDFEALQLYARKPKADPSATVAQLDEIERELGSPEAFAAAMPLLLCDRGVEFDDWAGMERSCLVGGALRCRVFYCDPMESNQKSQAERNHEQLRRILPKGRSDFDKLSGDDVALCCSHVNSYPLERLGGRCAIEASEGMVPRELLSLLGVECISADAVVLRPWLMAHAVEQ